jgi:flavin reductase (DIM6/NTAB) family NADH-FMN oxidoreductase RutF
MSIDARAFRDTVGQFVTGVTVIATEAEGSIRAMTANSFASLSLDPPLVLFCVGKTAHLSAYIRSAPGFSVNILAQTQRDLSTFLAVGCKNLEPHEFSLDG